MIKIVVYIALAIVLSTALPFFTIKPIYAQLPVDNTLPEAKRLGTTNILTFPDVNILYNNSVAPLDQEFVLIGSNSSSLVTQTKVAIKNPNYGLNDTTPTLRAGQNFRINSTTDADIVYSTVDVALVPIDPLPPSTKPSNIDPEDDLMQHTPLISVGNYVGDIGNLVIPKITHPGYYLLDVYLHYSFGVTAVYNTIVRVV